MRHQKRRYCARACLSPPRCRVGSWARARGHHRRSGAILNQPRAAFLSPTLPMTKRTIVAAHACTAYANDTDARKSRNFQEILIMWICK